MTGPPAALTEARKARWRIGGVQGRGDQRQQSLARFIAVVPLGHQEQLLAQRRRGHRGARLVDRVRRQPRRCARASSSSPARRDRRRGRRRARPRQSGTRRPSCRPWWPARATTARAPRVTLLARITSASPAFSLAARVAHLVDDLDHGRERHRGILEQRQQQRHHRGTDADQHVAHAVAADPFATGADVLEQRRIQRLLDRLARIGGGGLRAQGVERIARVARTFPRRASSSKAAHAGARWRGSTPPARRCPGAETAASISSPRPDSTSAAAASPAHRRRGAAVLDHRHQLGFRFRRPLPARDGRPNRAGRSRRAAGQRQSRRDGDRGAADGARVGGQRRPVVAGPVCIDSLMRRRRRLVKRSCGRDGAPAASSRSRAAARLAARISGARAWRPPRRITRPSTSTVSTQSGRPA